MQPGIAEEVAQLFRRLTYPIPPTPSYNFSSSRHHHRYNSVCCFLLSENTIISEIFKKNQICSDVV